jgi:hypothetical protein
MSRELKVALSGEGDFEVETDSAWHVEIDTGTTRITVTKRDTVGTKITVDDETIWEETQA